MHNKTLDIALRELLPMLQDFIVFFGYTEEQGRKFTEGYTAKLCSLPINLQYLGLARMYDPCMTAGFKAADIDELEAIEKALKLLPGLN